MERQYAKFKTLRSKVERWYHIMASSSQGLALGPSCPQVDYTRLQKPCRGVTQGHPSGEALEFAVLLSLDLDRLATRPPRGCVLRAGMPAGLDDVELGASHTARGRYNARLGNLN